MSGGIYAIHHLESDRQYIGSALNIAARWRLHRKQLKDGNHHCAHLQRAWNKYGAQAFEWTVLETCPAEQLLEREQHHLDSTRRKYNSSPTASSPRGTKHRPEVVAAMRQRVLAAYGNPAFAERHREAQRRRFEDPAQREAVKQRNSGVYRVTRPSGEVLEVRGITQFCRSEGLSVTQMTALARGARLQPYRGWLCEVITPSKTGQAKRKHRSYPLPSRPTEPRQAKRFAALSPQGVRLEGRNLAAFARQHGLDEHGLRGVAAGRQTHHAGWVIRWQAAGEQVELLPPVRGNRNVKHYILTDAGGEEYNCDNLLAFCKTRGLNAPSLVEVARGRRKQHKGWRCRYDQ